MVEVSRLNNCNVLVTGAAGLLGSALVEALLQQTTCQVYAACRNLTSAYQRFSHQANNPRLHFLEYDVSFPLTGNICYGYIVHAASPASPNSFSQQPVEVMMANILGTKHLLDYGRTHQLKRMLFISSGEVYGEGDSLPFKETDSGYIDCNTPRACYPSSKRAAETLCAAYGAEYGVDVVIARLCHTYGPGFTEKDNRVYAQFLRNVLQGEDIVLKSWGLQMRSWIYVEDAVNAILHILLKGERGEAYNVANPASCITIRQLAELIAHQAGKKVRLDIPAEANQGNTTPITCATISIDKLKALGWVPRYNMEDGLRKTLATLTAAR
jgi:nucleoside-diphosphate-sugar epimerase